MTLSGRNILLGVTGGIAAYKTPTLVRHLRNEGADVQVVLTRSAQEFVTPVTLQALSRHPVRSELWDAEAEAAMGHIELARWADLVLIAPASAHFMARLAHGLAPDLLTTLCLATDSPTVLAPAMNQAMWRDAATRRNAKTLIDDGKKLIGPNDGEQACGDMGPGRMAEPEELLRAVKELFSPRCLEGLKVLVTAGPTREAWDPVRYLSNQSSGKQGYAIAAAAAISGARTTLVSGPCRLLPPTDVEHIAVTSAQDMYEAVLARAADQDLVIGVAAVADYRPEQQAKQKIKKQGLGESLQITLTKNPDIIGAVAQLPKGPVVVGFAAETENALAHARSKRQRKHLDAIVVNDVSNQKIGFNSDYNAATLVWAQGEVDLAYQGKRDLAMSLVQRLGELFFAKAAKALAR